jgi:5-methylcytosine-specific restriction endonuclease McrA
MDAAVRELVRRRASNRCEYCLLPQEADPLFTFHVEHIVARQHHGTDDPANLALACHFCNLHKGPNLSGIDPVTQRLVRLFHPRTDEWSAHFQTEAGRVIGLTDTARATIDVLKMNASQRIELRLEASQA